MNVRILREFLADLPDDTEVIVQGKYCLKRADVKTGFAQPFNQYGQTHAGTEPSANYTMPVVILSEDSF